MYARTALASLLLGLGLSVLPACKGSALTDFTSALMQKLDNGSVGFVVGPDGTVSAVVKGADDKPVTGAVSGSITTSGRVDLKPAGNGVLQGKGLALSGALTQARYDLVVDGKPVTGVIYVPAAGTAELDANAQAQAKADLAGKVGPHGGRLQTVGDDVVEVVSNAETGEIRGYVLDRDLKPRSKVDGEMRLGLVGEKPELVALTAEPGGAFFTGKRSERFEPVAVAISMKGKGREHAAMMGLVHGVGLRADPAAPRIKLRVDGDVWGPDAGRGRAEHEEHGEAEHEEHGRADGGRHGRGEHEGHRKGKIKGP